MDRPAAGPLEAVGQRPRVAQEPARDVSLAPVASFFAMAFALSWAWWLVLLAGGERVRRGEGWPSHIPGMMGPLLAALVVLAGTEGRAGVRRWLAAMARVPRARRWQLASLGPLGFAAVGAVLAAALGELASAREFTSFSGVAADVALFALLLLVSAFGEEAG